MMRVIESDDAIWSVVPEWTDDECDVYTYTWTDADGNEQQSTMRVPFALQRIGPVREERGPEVLDLFLRVVAKDLIRDSVADDPDPVLLTYPSGDRAVSGMVLSAFLSAPSRRLYPVPTERWEGPDGG